MCKNSENGAKLPISTKYAVEKLHGGHSTGGTGNVRSALATEGRVNCATGCFYSAAGARSNRPSAE